MTAFTPPAGQTTPSSSESERAGDLLAISDLHTRYGANRRIAEDLRPARPGDWLIVAGDVADRFDDVLRTMTGLRERFEQVLWVPGNHELWTLPGDPVRERGAARYERLIAALRDAGVTTPEDPYPVWDGGEGRYLIAPLFLLYDYTFLPPGAGTKDEAVAAARRARAACSDEIYLHPDPYPSREAWSRARVEATRQRLDAATADAGVRTVLVNHYPLVRRPTRRLWAQEFALWCGTEATADWPARYRAEAIVYGHLHIPVTERIDGVRHIEASLGYPRQWQRREWLGGDLPRGVVRVLRG